LQRLKSRYPAAETFCCEGDRLAGIADGAFDVIVSTLALAHVSDASRAIHEWKRILRGGGSMIITDFHGDAIQAGMKRTFVTQGETIEIQHHVTNIEQLRNITGGCGLTVSFVTEWSIDDSVRSLFERDRALRAFERYKGLNLVFGLHVTKS
jgi:SAM-dependent methyltransferase